MDRSPLSLIAVHLQNAERQRGGCTKLLTGLFGEKNFLGGGDRVVRIFEAVAHGVALLAAHNGQRDGRPVNLIPESRSCRWSLISAWLIAQMPMQALLRRSRLPFQCGARRSRRPVTLPPQTSFISCLPLSRLPQERDVAEPAILLPPRVHRPRSRPPVM